MFNQARLKLTAWYLLIILTISIIFSVIIYQALTQELSRIESMQKLRSERMLREFVTGESPPVNSRRFEPPFLDQEIIQETKQRIIIFLVFINSLIAISAALAGYFLAGRTLRPIQQMVEKQDRFISDTSHELRTPLTNMRTELEVALLDPIDSNQASALIRSNLQEVIRLENLTNNLLQITRAEQLSLPKSHFNLIELTEQALTVVTPKANFKDIVILQAIEDCDLFCHGPSIIQLLIILLDNAIKYSPEHTSITISSLRDRHLHLIVSDQGPGIAPEDQAYIFDCFYRADAARQNSAAQGYGLGLSIAAEIIKKHQGHIKVENNQQGGATFTVTL